MELHSDAKLEGKSVACSVSVENVQLCKPVALRFRFELEFGNAGFLGEGKTGIPGEKPLGAGTRTNNKLNPDITPSAGMEPRQGWWEVSTLTTTASLF